MEQVTAISVVRPFWYDSMLDSSLINELKSLCLKSCDGYEAVKHKNQHKLQQEKPVISLPKEFKKIYFSSPDTDWLI
jgi:hypothetical protein